MPERRTRAGDLRAVDRPRARAAARAAWRACGVASAVVRSRGSSRRAFSRRGARCSSAGDRRRCMWRVPRRPRDLDVRGRADRDRRRIPGGAAAGAPYARSARRLEPARARRPLARRRVEALPTVVSVGYDRAFPHTLRLTLVPETPVAVLHRGTGTWLISARGRVVVPIRPGTYPALPRIWVPHATDVAVGGYVDPERAGNAARALALAHLRPASRRGSRRRR